MNASAHHATAYGFSPSLRPKVISVNPCRATLAKLNAIDFGVPRRTILRRRHGHTDSTPSLAAILFPVRQMTLGGSLLLLILRLAFGAYLLASGLDLLGATPAPADLTLHFWATIQILIGALAAAGLLTRVVMTFPAVVFTMLLLAAPTFQTAVIPLCCAAASATLLAAGSGWLSCDALLRVAIRRLFSTRHRNDASAMPPVLDLTPEERDGSFPLVTLIPSDE